MSVRSALALGVLIVAVGVMATQSMLLNRERAAHAADLAAWSKASAEASETNREIGVQRRRAQQGVIDAARTENAALQRRATTLDAVAGQLRDALAASAGEAAGDPAAASGGPPTAGAGLVLTDLYRSTDEEARSLARAFEAARAAGLACQRSYDSLTP